MIDDHLTSVKKIIAKIVAYTKKQLPKEKVVLVAKFIQLYYAYVALEDIKERSVLNLYGAAISHWELMLQRKPNESKIRVFNPQFNQDGWQSTHTIIQVITQDMPFLVDSIRMEINRLGLTTHLMIHIGGVRIFRNENHHIYNLLPYHTKCYRKGVLEAPISMEIDRQAEPRF